MKTKIIYSIVLLFLTVAFISKIPTAEEKSISNTQLQPGSAIPDNEFIIGAMHNALDSNYSHIKNTFHMNTYHKYTGPYWGWFIPNSLTPDPDDKWNGDSSTISNIVSNRINLNNTQSLRTIMDRPIIQYLTFGQRSDYQCEKISEGNYYWFYSYNNSVDNDTTIDDIQDSSQFGDGQWVKHCVPSLPSAGYIVDDLISDREQANKNRQNLWTRDHLYPWYIKPRIRIDSNFVI